VAGGGTADVGGDQGGGGAGGGTEVIRTDGSDSAGWRSDHARRPEPEAIAMRRGPDRTAGVEGHELAHDEIAVTGARDLARVAVDLELDARA
jgi:hypothetical protein